MRNARARVLEAAELRGGDGEDGGQAVLVAGREEGRDHRVVGRLACERHGHRER